MRKLMTPGQPEGRTNGSVRSESPRILRLTKQLMKSTSCIAWKTGLVATIGATVESMGKTGSWSGLKKTNFGPITLR